jgi:hypothetical protein
VIAIAELDETEALRLAGAVADDLDRAGLAERRDQFLQLVVGHGFRDISNVKFHGGSPAPRPSSQVEDTASVEFAKEGDSRKPDLVQAN